MGSREKLIEQILSGTSDRNISFESMRQLLRWFGFRERIRGDHHIFAMTEVAEILNLQPLPSGTAKAYQVKQVRSVIVRYKLRGRTDGT